MIYLLLLLFFNSSIAWSSHTNTTSTQAESTNIQTIDDWQCQPRKPLIGTNYQLGNYFEQVLQQLLLHKKVSPTKNCTKKK